MKLNQDWKINRDWPTLGKAIEKSERIFAFTRIKSAQEAEYLKNSKIMPEWQLKFKDTPNLSSVPQITSILSTFQAKKVGSNCENIAQLNGDACAKRPLTDLSKLAIFATHQKNSITKCLHTYAPMCNLHIKDSINQCKERSGRKVVNFIQSDYPNYNSAQVNSVDIAYTENMKYCQHLDWNRIERK